MKQKNEYTNIFNELHSRGVTYSVISYFVGLENTDIGNFMYSILIQSKDWGRVKNLSFYPTKFDKKVLECTLSNREIGFFRELEDEFILVQNHKDCRAWELKNDSLKEKLNKPSKLKQKLINLQNK